MTAIITDSLGFKLHVEIIIDEKMTGGRHITYADTKGRVPNGAKHIIRLEPNLSSADLITIAAHEAYHLFYSIRHLITADEETEAETFGHLVKRIYIDCMQRKP